MAGFSSFMKSYVKPEVYPLIVATCFAVGIAMYRIGAASTLPEVHLVAQKADDERFKQIIRGGSAQHSK